MHVIGNFFTGIPWWVWMILGSMAISAATVLIGLHAANRPYAVVKLDNDDLISEEVE